MDADRGSVDEVQMFWTLITLALRPRAFGQGWIGARGVISKNLDDRLPTRGDLTWITLSSPPYIVNSQLDPPSQ